MEQHCASLWYPWINSCELPHGRSPRGLSQDHGRNDLGAGVMRHRLSVFVGSLRKLLYVLGWLIIGYALVRACMVALDVGGPYDNYGGWASYLFVPVLAIPGIWLILVTRRWRK